MISGINVENQVPGFSLPIRTPFPWFHRLGFECNPIIDEQHLFVEILILEWFQTKSPILFSRGWHTIENLRNLRLNRASFCAFFRCWCCANQTCTWRSGRGVWPSSRRRRRVGRRPGSRSLCSFLLFFFGVFGSSSVTCPQNPLHRIVEQNVVCTAK